MRRSRGPRWQSQPRGNHGRWTRAPKPAPPWWFVAGFVVLGLILIYR
ncbi:hypothetical protein HUT11_35610 (plasmid) [Streptomyces seoulensis]|nr:hypothetical protein HUT11_35610 [Streptomyces seoulensis]